MKNSVFLLIIVFLLLSCKPQTHDHTLRISTTNWIGYTPLFYAKEKGSLDLLDIKLTNVVSLSENMQLYKAGNSDAFSGTQYEHAILSEQIPNIIPIMLFDRSNGGDMIMSNFSIADLQSTTKSIDAYLEMDSINFVLLDDFIKKFKIDESRINYIDRVQNEISTLQNINPSNPVLIVTYIPYNIKLMKSGFQEILSTKDRLDLLVVDALFTHQDEFIQHKEQFIALKKLIDEAILTIETNPQDYYQTVKPYFEGMSYEDFIKELEDIQWLNKGVNEALKIRMKESNFKIEALL